MKLPTMHPRERNVREAANELRSAIIDTWKKHDLTDVEVLSVVQEVMGEHVAAYCKYRIREERHGDTDTPGGLAKD